MDGSRIILKPPFHASLERYKRSIRFDCLDDAQDEALELFSTASQLLQPKVLFSEYYIDSHDVKNSLPSISIGDSTFSGKALQVLQEVNRVFAYVATCGDEMEEDDLSQKDMLAPYWLDVIKRQALKDAMSSLLSYIREHAGISKPRSLNPGSGNVDIWPIEEQRTLFNLLGKADDIGVTLHESCLMSPNKTLSGFMFSLPSVDWESCTHCERANCPDRRVPFKKVL